MYRRGEARRVSFPNALYSLCAAITGASLFRVTPRSNRAALTISREDRAAVEAELVEALPVIRERLQYIAAAAARVVLARVCTQASSQDILARVLLPVMHAPAAGGVAGGVAAVQDNPAPRPVVPAAAHVRRIMSGVRGLLLLSPTEVVDHGDDSQYAYIRSMDRGHLSYPRESFAAVFSLAIRFADVGLARV
jgi:hypothetical protein